MVMKTIFLTGSGTWIVPSDWNNAWNTVYAIGQGGSGTNLGGGGGGACAFTENYYANPGDTLTYSASLSPLFGPKYSGADSWLSRTGVAPTTVKQGILAKGGLVGDTRTGGSATNSIGANKFSGGTGTASTTGAGGGGGGSAGPNGAGANAGAPTIRGGAGGGSNGGAVPSGTITIGDTTYNSGGLNRYGQQFMGAGGISSGVGTCDILWAEEFSGKRAGPTGGDGGLVPGQTGPSGDSNGPWGTIPTCFRAGTLINTPNGLVPIEQIKVDDLVLAFDIGNTNNYSADLVSKKVTRIFSFIWNKKILAIKHDFGTLHTTGDHKILTSSHSEKFVKAELLRIGDIIYTADGKESQIISITNTEENYEIVYNIEVDDYHTFIADNIRVHNPEYNLNFIFAGAGGSGGPTSFGSVNGFPGGSGIIVIQYVPITSVKTVIFSGSGINTWTVPSDWNNLYNKIHGIGGGGGAISAVSEGGGGGGYARLNNYLLNPGDTVWWSAPSTSATDGSDAWFSRRNSEPGSIAFGLVARGGRGNVTGGGAGGGTSQSGGLNIGNVIYNGGKGGGTVYSGGGGAAGPYGEGAAGGTNPLNSSNFNGAGGGGANGGEVGSNVTTSSGANGGNNVKGTGGGTGATTGTTPAIAGSDGGGGGGGFYNGSFGASNFEPGSQGGMQAIWTQTETISGSTITAGVSVGPTGGTGAWAGYAAGAEAPGTYNQNNRATGYGSGGGSGVARGGDAVIIVQYVPITYFKTIFITSSQNYTVPADFDRNRNAIYAIGPGGVADATTNGGGGGAGGSFAVTYNADLIPGASYRANVSTTTDTWLNFLGTSNIDGSLIPVNSFYGILAKKGNNASSTTGGTQVTIPENLGNIINRGGAGGSTTFGRAGGGGAGGLNASGSAGGTGAQFCGGGGGGADGGSIGSSAVNNTSGGGGGINIFGYGAGIGATVSPVASSTAGLYGGGGGGGAGNGTGTNLTNDNGSAGGIQRLFVQTSDGAVAGPSGGGGGSGRDAASGTGGGSATSYGGGAGSGNIAGTPGVGIIVLMYLPKGVQGSMILMF